MFDICHGYQMAKDGQSGEQMSRSEVPLLKPQLRSSDL